MKLAILATHPIQYHSPLFAELSKACQLKVFYCSNPDQKSQGDGFGVEFKWDIPLLEGYEYKFLDDANPRYDCPSISEEIKIGKFDAVINFGWWFKTSKYALDYCNENNIPIYVRGDSQLPMNCQVKNFLKKLIYPAFLKKFNGFLSPGKRFSEYLNYYGINNDKIFFVPHFVNNEYFKNNSKNNFEGSSKVKTFLYCGKLISKKRPLDFLKALQTHDQLKVKGIIVGSGILEQSLKEYSRINSLNVEFMGFINQKEIPKIYSKADCLILPSNGKETWGLVINESFACGTPAIVSNKCGCTTDLIEEGKTGYSYQVSNIKELSSKMKLIIKNPKSKYQPFIKKKLETYCIKTASNNIISSIEHILKNK